jgi:hypothetical protein
MVLLLAEMVGWLRQGVGALIRQAGVRLMELLMEEEAESCLGNAADSSRIGPRTGRAMSAAAAW